ncbi:1-phosphofructokinase [Moorella naiadis]|uniref:1-phosphofructokinase n=1 Tax=Moorella naiadis (nom. illeg.) TaxID=3093670 RepID=UPI003D9C83B5
MSAPVVTVTLNPALDKTTIIENFEPAKTNRSRRVSYEAGGKGINVAKFLHELNYPVIATGFIAGQNGYLIKKALQQKGVPQDFVEITGETRVNLKVIDPVSQTETEINEPGFIVRPEDLQDLVNKLDALLGNCRLLVLSGSLPGGLAADVYAGFIKRARNRGIATVLDAEGEALKQGLRAVPLLVKPNKFEAETLLGEKLITPADAARAGAKIRRLGAEIAVISLGPLGAVGVDSQGALWAQPPRLNVGSTVGAGDAMVAVLARALCEGIDLREDLPRAVAAGTWLAASRAGRRELTLENLACQVRVVVLETAPGKNISTGVSLSG